MVNCTHAPPEAHSDAGVAGAGVCSTVLSYESCPECIQKSTTNKRYIYPDV